jgi:hypothetical protein
MFHYYCSTQDLEEIDGKRKVLLTSYHVTPILEHCKVSFHISAYHAPAHLVALSLLAVA